MTDLVSLIINGKSLCSLVLFSCLEDTVNQMIADLASPRQVVMLRSYFGMAFPFGISSGTALGGILVDAVGWRW
jgi:MFS family permease